MKTDVPVLLLLLCLTSAWRINAFVGHTLARRTSGFVSSLNLFEDEDLFEDEEEEMIPIATSYLHAKCRAVAASHGHDKCSDDDAREVLRTVLPPVTPGELAEEVDKTMKNLAKDGDSVDEDAFVNAMLQNKYWKKAGSIVVKELMYMDSLYHYYHKDTNLLDNDDFNTLKDNLTWEGSSVATMAADEALFVTAVAASRRGEPILEDDEYASLKQRLRDQDSWVTARQQDALERLNLDTFLGYLHQAL